jgi:hypothetical protein
MLYIAKLSALLKETQNKWQKLVTKAAVHYVDYPCQKQASEAGKRVILTYLNVIITWYNLNELRLHSSYYDRSHIREEFCNCPTLVLK